MTTYYEINHLQKMILFCMVFGIFFFLFFSFLLKHFCKKSSSDIQNDYDVLIQELSTISFEESDAKIKANMIDIFEKKIKGKKGLFFRFCHEEGHWLEKQFGITKNNLNKADYMGYEIKKESSKITFGDWSADEYIFKPSHVIPSYNKNILLSLSRTQFLRIFGVKSQKGIYRYSWSGLCVPKINQFNKYGQMLVFDQNDNIYAIYSYLQDSFVKSKPKWVTYQPYIILAFWSREKIRSHVTKKFGQRGFVICKKENEIYSYICFGKPLTFESWCEGVKKGFIFLDSGMYEGNDRNYSMWRASSSFWDSLIDDVY